MKDFSHIRKEFMGEYLSVNDVDPHPYNEFEKWFSRAMEAKLENFNAFVLSTVDQDDFPNSRILLLKELNEEGFIFFTNYNSTKGKELENSPKASMVFYWTEFHIQIRVRGIVKKATPEQSDNYFLNRPAGSKLGAWASPQSSELKDRAELENLLKETKERFGDDPQERPPHWGGYILEPLSFEFWQGRESRLHDRIKYTLEGDNWRINRLAP